MNKPFIDAFAFRGSISRRASVLVGLGASFAVLAAWQIVSWRGFVDPTFLPSPIDIGRSLWTMTREGQIVGNALVSLGRILVAFALSAAMAIPIGLLMSSYRPVNAALEPIVDFVRYLPTPALVPISIIWFGIGEETKIFLLWLGTFFQLVLLVVDDANRVPGEYVEIARTLGARPFQILVDISWRAMLPNLVDNLRITLGWCWTYLIVAEIVASDSGLGYVIWNARRYMQTDQVMAGVFVIGLIGLVSDQLIRALHRRLFRYLKPVN
ncbi:ABC transporter permease [Paraburkholderia caballeronis]|uniref:NitT/TauT family transport system permease protein n=1 Tax=Paraburkholderia caballeronis TaxID=416943 RepID=A0A1H7M1C9_9BURK|nr:ABC transporter permease [Paraburkholderia caballeronis]PXW28665.1 NitT/TauT family transport system permease protein [Paraburkholderia caballeronis]PXX04031.1 NitT/TauT family transport system permease protein [Paraburkholderia caballeronis]RAK04775.1 NitT/TauT family transport system permease protein [Paraburkholderia caballeronis]TDV19676.1 NitT/TauT family transport system permease protein [Paraburkholderia caballeronis]TDV22275.1 NitT/TauT family transport system permease protein [Para